MYKFNLRIWLKFAFIMLFFTVFLQFCNISNASEKESKGSLWLVSVGVGDADLITVRAINMIKKSDVVICHQRTKEKLTEYLEGKEFMDISLAGWRNYGKDCSGIEDKEKRAACEKDTQTRAELIKQIRLAIDAGKTLLFWAAETSCFTEVLIAGISGNLRISVRKLFLVSVALMRQMPP